ncbi:uncharacterized protein HMPREF1541_01131 [Cyphellophora europaea CBS 101466]|uniref:Uncharacterized protein n=1 Tax=Cyphellophora europaea (strain CBS 101466) TaxID=1220924 RepID=W2SE34_CYPE1|nr:uncharacterized protein HMPREF1541_01131 [Cyphellophora europaea CBS 101466]ETN46942.1 hypothetical protein HMPREF1541_01131 [Cyphellophora europaea CBS 101466]
MVIGLMILTAIPTVTGVAQAISGQKKREEQAQEEKRMQKFHIDIICEADAPIVQKEIHGHRIVLRDDRVFIGEAQATNPSSEGYVAEAFYIEYPDKERNPVPLGLVSQTRADPPLLNWIYVDNDTAELKYGNKSQSIEHRVGPWDWTKDETYVKFAKAQLFVAVENPKTKKWQLYWDNDEDGLSKYCPLKWKKVYVTLERTIIPGT